MHSESKGEIIDVLDYYDGPSIFLVRQEYNYTILVVRVGLDYNSKYFGVKLDSASLKRYLNGKTDLRNTFLMHRDKLVIGNIEGAFYKYIDFAFNDVTEEMLADEGYYNQATSYVQMKEISRTFGLLYSYHLEAAALSLANTVSTLDEVHGLWESNHWNPHKFRVSTRKSTSVNIHDYETIA